MIAALVQKHIGLHADDARKSLEAVSSIKSVREDLEKLADADVQASLAHVSIVRETDPGQTLPMPEDEGRLAGRRFRILRPHARGGLGEVHVARDLELQRDVALKEIQARYADIPESRSRFLLEAEITGGLEHPGIVPVYSLGATLYHLLTGQAPFADRDVHALLAKVRRGDFAEPRRMTAAIPPRLEAICVKAMALRREDRYATPKEMADDVEHWLADEPVRAWPEPWRVKARRWVGRHRVALTSAAAVLVVGVAALVAGNVLLSQANADLTQANVKTNLANEDTKIAYAQLKVSEKEARELAARESKARALADAERKEKTRQLKLTEALLYNSTIREAASHYRDGDYIAMRAALDATRWDRRGPEYGCLTRQCDQTMGLVGVHLGTVNSLALSSDGKRLFAGSGDKTIKVWDLEAGQLNGVGSLYSALFRVAHFGRSAARTQGRFQAQRPGRIRSSVL